MMKCHFCNAQVADTSAAISADWIPSFWIGVQEVRRPVCPACTSARLERAEDGLFRIAEHNDYADAAESAERGSAWLQAAGLWKLAADVCRDERRHRQYLRAAERCRKVVKDCRPLPNGTTVAFDIEGGLAVGTGVVLPPSTTTAGCTRSM